MEHVYAPWRSEYFGTKKSNCVFCEISKGLEVNDKNQIINTQNNESNHIINTQDNDKNRVANAHNNETSRIINAQDNDKNRVVNAQNNDKNRIINTQNNDKNRVANTQNNESNRANNTQNNETNRVINAQNDKLNHANNTQDNDKNRTINAQNDEINRKINAQADEANRVIFRDEFCFCVMNRYPYTPGHFLIIPHVHVDSPDLLESGVWAHLNAIALGGVKMLYEYGASGVNFGANIKSAAGAGIPAHLHLHLVPRWERDTNFFTSIGDARAYGVDFDSVFEKMRILAKKHLAGAQK